MTSPHRGLRTGEELSVGSTLHIRSSGMTSTVLPYSSATFVPHHTTVWCRRPSVAMHYASSKPYPNFETMLASSG